MTRTTRRGLLRAGAAATAGSAALATTRRAAAQDAFGGWLSNVSNYDGVVDRTGQSEVTITVGAKGNNGNFAFGPAAVRVDPGTTVVWEWNGKGGQHNVVAKEGADFESKLTGEAGFTFSRTLDAEGVVKYYCQPHEALGMKGVVVVGSGGGSSGGSGGSDGGGGDGAATPTPVGSGGGTPASSGPAAGTPGTSGSSGRTALTLVGGGVVGAALSPLLFGVFLKLVGTGDEGR
ncbi:MAG: halocyanin domain-containing protein [Haloferacaceae archaeon]